MESEWQSKLSSIKERNQHMFNNTLFSDVEFFVVDSKGDAITVPAHKYVLAISSPVFEAMFYGTLAETSRNINLPDCTAEGLLEIFRYMYYDEVELTGSNVMEVLYLAKKYIVPSLAEKCTQFLEKDLKPEDAFIVLPQTMELGDDNLQTICWEVIDSGTQEAVKSGAFMDVTQEILCDILERESLCITELELFRAAVRWAEHKIRQQKLTVNGETVRRILGDKVIRLIRFPLITIEQFVDCVIPKDILDKREIVELLTHFVSPGKASLSLFKEEIRKGLHPYESCKRFQTIIPVDHVWGKGKPYNGLKEDSITFTVSSKIYLVALRMFGDKGKSYSVKLSINNGSLIPFLQQEETAFTCDNEQSDGYYGFTVELDKPARLDPGIEYTIKCVITGHQSSFGQKGMKKVYCRNVNFCFTDKCSSNGTNPTDGQFPELLFYPV